MSPSSLDKPHDPGSSGFWWIPGGMLALAAAAILAWWVWPPSEQVRSLAEGTPADSPTPTPLPDYALETEGGVGTSADEPGRHRYRRDSAFAWTLRPKRDVSEAVGVRAFAFVDGGRAGLPLRLDDLTEVADAGTVRIAGEIGALGLEPGRYTVALVVGPPDALPDEATKVSEPSDAWAVRRLDISIE